MLALTTEALINTALCYVAACSQIAAKGLKIRCPNGCAGSTLNLEEVVAVKRQSAIGAWTKVKVLLTQALAG